MKSVMISIKPRWCELIGNGKKTIEVRKTKPKCDTPFKCYIYCTKDFYNFDYMPKNGRIIGEFICDNVKEAHFMQDFGYAGVYKGWNDVEDCLSNTEIYDYMGEKDILYGWRISDLVIYDKPKELDTFYRYCGDNPKCHNCEFYYSEHTEEGSYYQCVSPHEYCKPITRPPQSWCYVEEGCHQ